MKSKSKEGILKVSKHFTHKGELIDESASEILISVKEFQVEPAMIGVNRGATVNLGDFNSVRVEVIATVPTYMEEIEDAYEYVNNITRKYMETELKEIRIGRKQIGLSSGFEDDSPL